MVSLSEHHRRLVIRGAAPRADLPALLAALTEEFQGWDITELRTVGGGLVFHVAPLHRRRGLQTVAPMSGGRVAVSVDGDDVVIDMHADFARQTLIGAAVAGFCLVSVALLGAQVLPLVTIPIGGAVFLVLLRRAVLAGFGDRVERAADETISGRTLTVPARRDHGPRAAR